MAHRGTYLSVDRRVCVVPALPPTRDLYLELHGDVTHNPHAEQKHRCPGAVRRFEGFISMGGGGHQASKAVNVLWISGAPCTSRSFLWCELTLSRFLEH